MADWLESFVDKLASNKKLFQDITNSDSFQKYKKSLIDKEIRNHSSQMFKKISVETREYAETLKFFIQERMKSHGLGKYSNMSVSLKQRNTDGAIVAFLEFDKLSNLSPSLSKKYGFVILPRLLNTGYNAQKPIYGYWASKDAFIRGLQKRDALNFIKDAVDDFNYIYKGDVEAEYIEQPAY